MYVHPSPALPPPQLSAPPSPGAAQSVCRVVCIRKSTCMSSFPRRRPHPPTRGGGERPSCRVPAGAPAPQGITAFHLMRAPAHRGRAPARRRKNSDVVAVWRVGGVFDAAGVASSPPAACARWLRCPLGAAAQSIWLAVGVRLSPLATRARRHVPRRTMRGAGHAATPRGSARPRGGGGACLRSAPPRTPPPSLALVGGWAAAGCRAPAHNAHTPPALLGASRLRPPLPQAASSLPAPAVARLVSSACGVSTPACPCGALARPLGGLGLARIVCARPVVGRRGRPRRFGSVALYPPPSGARVGVLKFLTVVVKFIFHFLTNFRIWVWMNLRKCTLRDALG